MCRIYATQDPSRYELVTRRLRLNGQSTSVRLEASFWQILDDVARQEGLTTPAFVSKLHSEVLELHGEPQNFTSVLRCSALVYIETSGQIGARLMAAE